MREIAYTASNLEESEGMPPQEIFEIWVSEIVFLAFSGHILKTFYSQTLVTRVANEP